jgi:hypothetical protein
MAVNETIARAMLLKMHWDLEKLSVKYFEDPEKMIKELVGMDRA